MSSWEFCNVADKHDGRVYVFFSHPWITAFAKDNLNFNMCVSVCTYDTRAFKWMVLLPSLKVHADIKSAIFMFWVLILFLYKNA